MTQRLFLRKYFFILLICAVAIVLAMGLHLAASIHDFKYSDSFLDSYHIENIYLSLFFLFIGLLLIYLKGLKKSYRDVYELDKHRELHQDLLENLPIAVAELDALLQEKITNQTFRKFSQQIGQSDLKALIQQLSDTLGATKNISDMVLKKCYPDVNTPRKLWIEWHLHHRPDNSYLLLGRDISSQRDTQDKLTVSQRILEDTPIGVMVVDTNFKIEYINRSFEQITGYSPKEALGKNPSILSSGKQDSKFFEKMYNNIAVNGYWQGEIWNRKKDGEIYLEWLSITALKDDCGEISHYIGMFSEITALEHVREKLRTLAYYDGLTLLANRTLFNDKLERLIKNKSDKYLCVVFIDLDGFKRINDSFGHQVGDQILVEFAKRLKNNIRHADVIARWGGDEFIIAIEVTDAHVGISHFCEKQMEILSKPLSIDGRDWMITSSIGISIYGEYASSASELVRNADLAMYQAKRRGKNRYEIFSPGLHEEVSEIIQIEGRLREAIISQQIDVFFQPQVLFESNKIYGLEALARWEDEELGNVSPQKFISVAEDTGMIDELSNLVFSKAFNKFNKWQKIDPNLCISINISASQLQSDSLIKLLEGLIELYSIDARKIKLEITEDVFIADIERSIYVASCLKKLNFNISLDDFGTGFSSLSHLKDFEIDELKIDRSFIKNITTSRRNKAIVASVVAMTKILEINCVIEGVETSKQLEELQNIGGSIFQGYLFYKPMPAEKVDILLKKSDSALL